MRLYHLCRREDVSGTSGTGHVAEVAEFDDGVVVRWMRNRNAAAVASTTVFNSLEDLLKVHGHGGRTEVELVADTEQVIEDGAAAARLRRCLRHCVDSMTAQGMPVPAEVVAALDGSDRGCLLQREGVCK